MADAVLVFGEGYFLLLVHDGLCTGAFCVFIDLVGQLCCGGILFGVEGEAAECIEPGPFYKFEEFSELVFCFAGETCYYRCAQDDFWHG